MLEGKESRDEDHDYPVYMAVVVVGHMARLGGCVAQQESCCWCWRGEAAPRTLGAGAGAEEEFLVVLFLYPLSDATRHQHQAGARQGMSFRQMCAGVHLLWLC